MSFPGRFAKDLYRNGLGKYTSGGSPRHSGGSFGFWMDHDPYKSPALTDVEPAHYMPPDETNHAP